MHLNDFLPSFFYKLQWCLKSFEKYKKKIVKCSTCCKWRSWSCKKVISSTIKMYIYCYSCISCRLLYYRRKVAQCCPSLHLLTDTYNLPNPFPPTPTKTIYWHPPKPSNDTHPNHLTTSIQTIYRHSPKPSTDTHPNHLPTTIQTI